MWNIEKEEYEQSIRDIKKKLDKLKYEYKILTDGDVMSYSNGAIGMESTISKAKYTLILISRI